MVTRGRDLEKEMNYKGAEGKFWGGNRNVLYIIVVVVDMTVYIVKIYRTVHIKGEFHHI